MRAANRHAAADAPNERSSLTVFQRHVLPLYQHFALESRYDVPFILLLLAMELLIGRLIISCVAYTEIDWTAYVQQVELARSGERDYRMIRGDTGPLVYPAGFLYLFGIIYDWTDQGKNIAKAQTIFLGFYLVTQGLVLMLFQERIAATRQIASKLSTSSDKVHHVWAWRVAMGVLCLSKRLHSIFLLRLFNDGPTMMLVYASIVLFQKHYWRLGCLVFSLAVSVKMNVLLFAPGLLLILLQALPDLKSVVATLVLYCGLPQLVLGAPFLLAHPISYVRKAFEFDRAFFYEWTVNWKFLPEHIFVAKPLSLLLLALHIAGLAVCAVAWVQSARREVGQALYIKGGTLTPHYIAYTLLASNFIGIAFARTLHYQFYAWYFHAVPYLVWSASTRQAKNDLLVPQVNGCLAIVCGMEFAFLTYPATATSSAVLQLCHLHVLATLRPPRIREQQQDVKAKLV